MALTDNVVEPTGGIVIGAVDRELVALNTAAGAALRSDIRTLRLTGPDRVRFLNGMVTQDVASLGEGQGVWAVKTNAKGRIEALARVRASSDALFLDVRAVVAPVLLETLERYIIMDDVALHDISPARQVISVLGPRARDVVLASGIGPVPVDEELAPNGFVRRGGVEIIRDRSLGVYGYELHVPTGTAVAQYDTLLSRGAIAVTSEAIEVMRVEAGIPIDGKDLDAETLPMEAGLEAAISSTKGCYVGQEVIARATLQGHVNYALIGLVFAGTPPAEGAELVEPGAEQKRVGEVSSVVFSPTLGAWIGLGFVRKTHQASGTQLATRGPKGDAVSHPATVTTLPIVPGRPRL
jgi:folate-binding protein YgfZ